ncbi:hypothetical protein G3576_17595 [Roseomonas stagni]|uniref:Uncharacterized protein n=1 Tax=Falsiroseomonas algicola TaxID=2716930 RepID=A0A6M1LP74_9PROT|nr:hypothetical protein [Falsiroseomonas algicola]NGM21842.1 hypothetical protein [Falsiroseomonas algicola]
MSLILKFPDASRRAEFLDVVKTQRPELLQFLEPSAILPHLMARTDPAADAWLRARADGYGKAFADVQFRTLATS